MTRRRTNGFSLVSALFLLIVLAALGGFMVTLSTTQHYTTAYALQGARAYHAAHSGLEWGIAAAVSGGACPAAAGPGALGGDLASFNVAVACNATAHAEGGSNFNIYTITSTATSASPAFGQPGYASRQLRAVVTDAPVH